MNDDEMLYPKDCDQISKAVYDVFCPTNETSELSVRFIGASTEHSYEDLFGDNGTQKQHTDRRVQFADEEEIINSTIFTDAQCWNEQFIAHIIDSWYDAGVAASNPEQPKSILKPVSKLTTPVLNISQLTTPVLNPNHYFFHCTTKDAAIAFLDLTYAISPGGSRASSR